MKKSKPTPEVWFCNSCGIMARIPVTSNEEDVVWTNDSPVPLTITHVALYLPAGCFYDDRAVIIEKQACTQRVLLPGNRFTIYAPIIT